MTARIRLLRPASRTRPALVVAAAFVGSIALWLAAGQAAGKSETLRYHVKDVSTRITHADGTVDQPPRSASKPESVAR